MQPSEAGTVAVHVQVIDAEPFALDMVVPTYLSVEDLTTRVARDAGLGAYWEDGTRRAFYLRARGRLLEPHEKLEQLGIVPNELLHLMPQPPADAGLQERPPEYPPTRGYPAAGNLSVLSSVLGMLAFTAAWALGLTVSRGFVLGFFPGMGLALLVTSFARYLWGGLGSSVRIPTTSLGLYVPLMMIAGAVALLAGGTPMELVLTLSAAFIGGILGILLGWLAWYGAVEPLPELKLKDVVEAEAMVTWPCAICGNPVTAEIKAECRFSCGRVFHRGCYQASSALAPDGSTCAVCGFVPGQG